MDRGHVQDYLGSVFGIAADSTDYDKAVINAAWDMITAGPTLDRFTAAICALFGVPVTGGTEVVSEVFTQAGATIIATDANVYTVPGNAVLNPAVTVGAALPAATPLPPALQARTASPRPLFPTHLSATVPASVCAPDRTRFILVGTSHAGNVGAAARAMKVPL